MADLIRSHPSVKLMLQFCEFGCCEAQALMKARCRIPAEALSEMTSLLTVYRILAGQGKPQACRGKEREERRLP